MNFCLSKQSSSALHPSVWSSGGPPCLLLRLLVLPWEGRRQPLLEVVGALLVVEEKDTLVVEEKDTLVEEEVGDTP